MKCSCQYKQKVLVLFLVLVLFTVTAVYADSYQYLLSGTIDNSYPVFMVLTVDDKTVTGYYVYTDRFDPLSLEGTMDSEGSCTLIESTPMGVQTGTFKGLLEHSGFSGTWANGKSRFTFNLEKTGVSVTSRKGMGDTYYSSITYPLFSDTDKYLVVNEDLAESMEQSESEFFDMGIEYYQEDFFLSWVQDIDYSILLLNNNIISLLFSTYSYQGGAHGNSTYFTRNYMQVEGVYLPIGLSDIITQRGFFDLSQMILADLKEQGSTFALDEVVSSFSWSDLADFCVESRGLRFFFEPYSVGSYAEGSFEVSIDFADIQNLITPVFENYLTENTLP